MSLVRQAARRRIRTSWPLDLWEGRTVLLGRVIVLSYFLSFSVLFLRAFVWAHGIPGHNWDWVIPEQPQYMISGLFNDMSTWTEHWLGNPRPGGQALVVAFFFALGLLGFNGHVVAVFMLLLFPTLSGYFATMLVREVLGRGSKFVGVFSVLGGTLYAFSGMQFFLLLDGTPQTMMGFALFPAAMEFGIRLARSSMAEWKHESAFWLLSLIWALMSLSSTAQLALSVVAVAICGAFCAFKLRCFLRRILLAIAFTAAASSVINVPLVWYLIFSGVAVQPRPGFTSDPGAFLNQFQGMVASLFSGGSYNRNIYVLSVPAALSPFVIVTGLLLLTLGFSGFLSSKQRDVLKIVPWAVVWILSEAFSEGRLLLGSVADLVYSFPLMLVLRSLIYYETPKALAFSTMTAVSSTVILGLPRKRQIASAVLIILVLALFLSPWYSGDLGSRMRSNDYDGTLDIFSEPPDYQHAVSILAADRESFNVLPIPSPQCFVPTTYQRVGYPFSNKKYPGAEPSLVNSAHGVIFSSQNASAFGIQETSDAIDYLTAHLEVLMRNQTLFTNLLGLFNVKYVLLMKGASPCSDFDTDRARDSLLKIGSLQEIVSGEAVSLFRLRSAAFVPRIYSVDSVIRLPIIKKILDLTAQSWQGLNLIGEPLSGPEPGLRVEGGNSGLLVAHFPRSLDLSGYDELSFKFRTNSSQKLSLTFMSENANGYTLGLEAVSSSWSRFRIDLDSTGKIGSPVGWTHIGGLVVGVVTNDSRPFFLDLTDIEFSVGPTVSIAAHGSVVNQSYVESNSTMPKLMQARVIQILQLSPTSYQLEVESAGPFVLVLAQSFHPLWKLYYGLADDLDSPFAEPVAEANHFRINSYANGWLVQQSGHLFLSIAYAHQPVFYATAVVSAATILCILGAYVYFRLFSRREGRMEKEKSAA